MLARGTKDKEHAMSQISKIAFVGIDIGKNSFHVVGHDERGAIVLRQKWSRVQVEARFANMVPTALPTKATRLSSGRSRKSAAASVWTLCANESDRHDLIRQPIHNVFEAASRSRQRVPPKPDDEFEHCGASKLSTRHCSQARLLSKSREVDGPQIHSASRGISISSQCSKFWFSPCNPLK
jgi:hypothetical protein